MSTVLVTGGSGFVGSHTVLQLLKAGHEVRTTVRKASRADEVREMLRRGGVEPDARLSFFVADLEQDAGWAEAVAGCDYVQHIASPFPLEAAKDVDALIGPARDGTLRVMRAARDAGVKRVVLTSSFAAIGYGHPSQTAPFDESDWTDINGPGVTAYIKSKAVAERAAWDFIAAEGGAMELSVINPVGVFGPALGRDLSTSAEIIRRMLSGGVPGAPRIYFGIVDVRDVADLHVRAMTHPGAKGERFLAISGAPISMHEVSMMLRRRLGASANRAPALELPDWLVRFAALFDANARAAVSEIGKIKGATGAKAERVFGWTPISKEDAVVATGQSLIDLGLLKAR